MCLIYFHRWERCQMVIVIFHCCVFLYVVVVLGNFFVCFLEIYVCIYLFKQRLKEQVLNYAATWHNRWMINRVKGHGLLWVKTALLVWEYALVRLSNVKLSLAVPLFSAGWLRIISLISFLLHFLLSLSFCLIWFVILSFFHNSGPCKNNEP